ncbi:MAG: hypothetical protein KAY24_19855 [Candidatus Eisenbacteria sp.]|nr:hypothetical protein [Candidatus Eisenbacteria bacterium]
MNPKLTCPSCGKECKQNVLKESGDLLVQCSLCGNIHHVPLIKEPAVITVRAVISKDQKSSVGSIELIENERCAVGDLLVAELGDDVLGVEVTGIEVGDKRRKRSIATDISTIWTREVENVVVRVSVHDGRKTLPMYSACDGEDDFIIGDIYKIDNVRFRVVQMKLRDGALMRKEGWKAYARKIKRVYAIRV